MKSSFAENSKALALVVLLAAPLSYVMQLSLSLALNPLWAVLFCAVTAILLDAMFASKRVALVCGGIAVVGVSLSSLLIGAAGRAAFSRFGVWAISFISMWSEYPPVYGTLLTLILCFLITLFVWLFGKKLFFFPAVFLFTVGLILLEWMFGVFTVLLPATFACGALIPLWAKAHQVSTLRRQKSQTRASSVAVYLVPVAVIMVLLSIAIVPEDSGKWRSQNVYRTFERVNNYLANYTGFSRARNSYSIGSSGYMPLGNRLGGAVTLTDTKVLRVTSSRPVLLRGTIYNEYTGQNWEDNQTSRRYRFDSNADIRNRTFDIGLPDVDEPLNSEVAKFITPLHLSITPLMESSSTMFTPFRGLTSVKPNGFLTVFPYFNTEGEVFHTSDLHAGDGYSIDANYLNYQSADFPLMVNTLLKQGVKDDPGRIKDIRATYLRLPQGISQGVYDLAKNTTEGLETDYDKAAALCDLLRQFNYTLSPKDPPQGQDFISYFLESSHEGYCTYFATAMAVLARMENIPSRYVVGYMMTDSGKEGTDYIVRAKNAHAWAELYFEGIGWIPFDATPSGSAPSDTSGSGTGSVGFDPRDMIPQRTAGPSGSGVTPPPQQEEITLAQLLAWAWVLPVGALLCLGLWVLYAAMKARVTMSLAYACRRFADNRRRTAWFYQATLRLLSYYNYPIKRGETLYAYSARIGRWLRLSPGSFDRVAELMVRISYSQYEPTDDDVKFMADFRAALARYTYETVGMWYYLIHQILGFRGKAKQQQQEEKPKTRYYMPQKPE